MNVFKKREGTEKFLRKKKMDESEICMVNSAHLITQLTYLVAATSAACPLQKLSFILILVPQVRVRDYSRLLGGMLLL